RRTKFWLPFELHFAATRWAQQNCSAFHFLHYYRLHACMTEALEWLESVKTRFFHLTSPGGDRHPQERPLNSPAGRSPNNVAHQGARQVVAALRNFKSAYVSCGSKSVMLRSSGRFPLSPQNPTSPH